MRELKVTYKSSMNKKKVRDFLISYFSFKKVIGLAGPDINIYINHLKHKGYRNFEIFEKDSSILLKQLITINSGKNISLIYNDILAADNNREDTLYDLDFCCMLSTVSEHIKKFRNNFIITVSARMGIKATVDMFFKLRNEIVLSEEEIESSIKYTRFTTEQGEYLFTQYYDTSAMCCFAKII
jgi:hypothetical protein